MEQCLKDVHVFNSADESNAKTEFHDAERIPGEIDDPNQCRYHIKKGTIPNFDDPGPAKEPISNDWLAQPCTVPTSVCNKKKKVNFMNGDNKLDRVLEA